MEKSGIFQWNDSYPNEKIIRDDLDKKQLWIYGSSYEACVTILKTEQTCYIKRLVVSSQNQRKGMARYILKDIILNEIGIKEIKISTNHMNIPMRNLLTSLKFIPNRNYRAPDREEFGLFIEYVYLMRS